MDEDTVSLADEVPLGCPYLDNLAQRADAIGTLISRAHGLPPDSELYLVVLETSRALISTISPQKTRLQVVK